MAKASEKRIGVTAFKARCLSLVDEVAQGKVDRVVLTKRGHPVAEIVPTGRGDAVDADPWGALRDMVRMTPGSDLTEPLDIAWDAEAGVLLNE